MSEYMKVSDLRVGDTIDTSLGYVYTIKEIEVRKPPFGTPDYWMTVQTNFGDRKELPVTLAGTSVAKVIGRDFSYDDSL